jgi:hypothetical protein
VKTAPVLVRVKKWDVSICVLAVLPDGSLAIDSQKRFRPCGSVEHDPHGNNNLPWEWSSGGASGRTRTKTEAISTMLSVNGFHEVPVEATIPDLLAGLTEGES